MVAPGSVSAMSSGVSSSSARFGSCIHAAASSRLQRFGGQGQEAGVAYGPLRFGHAELLVLISVAGVRAPGPTDEACRLRAGEAQKLLEAHHQGDGKSLTDLNVRGGIVPVRHPAYPVVFRLRRGGLLCCRRQGSVDLNSTRRPRSKTSTSM